MLGITTMKLFQQWIAEHSTEKHALVEENRSVLIVGMSATALESEQEEAFNYGMHFFCPKPVSLELLTIILEAKRAHHGSLDAAVDQVCDITGTSANDAVATSNASPNNDAADNNNSNNNNGDASANNVNPKNKWTFFRSYKQSRGGSSSKGGDAMDDSK